jgi:2-polyprenyl-3-methyl-5-hydroxy-6-metoxy-1,4-benzoquinol methylase
MRIAEAILFQCARALYSTELAHSSEMKNALLNRAGHDVYRAGEIKRILEAIDRYDVSIAGRTVLDFGCNNGAISSEYLRRGAARVIGIDIDEMAIAKARELHSDQRLVFLHNTTSAIPLPDRSVDVVISYDVFEHVSKPAVILKELHRITVPGGKVVIATWSWRHPFAPHLWSVMPVPWAHLCVSERTLLRVCRRVYHSPWYVPNMHDYDADGQRLPDKFTHESISTEYLNKFLISDFERAFQESGFDCKTHAVPFASRYARWTRPLVRLPWFREFLTGSAWFVLSRSPGTAA